VLPATGAAAAAAVVAAVAAAVMQHQRQQQRQKCSPLPHCSSVTGLCPDSCCRQTKLWLHELWLTETYAAYGGPLMGS
jgi:hypothetical protein